MSRSGLLFIYMVILMNKERIRQIKVWLSFGKRHRSGHCPFYCEPGAGLICQKLFPKMKVVGPMYLNERVCGVITGCPCSYYSIEDVTAIAEEVVDANIQSSREKDTSL
jgi:hypothetical protein